MNKNVNLYRVALFEEDLERLHRRGIDIDLPRHLHAAWLMKLRTLQWGVGTTFDFESGTYCALGALASAAVAVGLIPPEQERAVCFEPDRFRIIFDGRDASEVDAITSAIINLNDSLESNRETVIYAVEQLL